MKKLSTLLLLFLFCFTVFAQDKTEEQKMMEFMDNISKFNRLYPQEKVYLHFDNTAYFIGEPIWFKAYVTTSENHHPTTMSKVLYVELLSAEGSVLESKKVKIENGQAAGGFVLKTTYFGGFYQVRAYTRCMLNFGEHVVFSRVFPVYDQPVKAGDYSGRQMSVKGQNLQVEKLRKEEKLNNLNLSFFPEGGNLISGIINRVAFKATDREGKSAYVTGKIFDNFNNEVTSFEALHLGMGSFLITPEEKKYTAKVSYEGREYKFDLPQSNPSGYVMMVENLHPEEILVQVEKTANIPNQTFGISFSCRGKVYGFKAFEMDSKGQFIMRLPKKDLPPGVFQITLFTAEGDVLAQRQAFVNNNIQAIPITATNIRSKFEPFSPIEINFEVKDEGGYPVETTFSLSVRDDYSDIATNNTENIQNNILLSSELKGYIENPAYYFQENTNRSRLALDLLMLTQGWVRYQWKQMAGVEPFEVKHTIENSLILEGRVLSPGIAKPQDKINVTMWMTSELYGDSQRGKCDTDGEGKFNFKLEDITGDYELNLYVKRKNKRYASRITVDNRNLSPPVFAYTYDEKNPLISKRAKYIEAGFVETKEQNIQKIIEIEDARKYIDKVRDSIRMSYTLPEVEIKSTYTWHNKWRRDVLPYAIAHYDVIKEIDKYRDEGESETDSVFDFLFNTDLNFSFSEGGKFNRNGELVRRSNARYKGRRIYISMNASIGDFEHFLITYNAANDSYSLVAVPNEDGTYRRLEKGIRRTYYEGFAPVMEFYHPDYSYVTLPKELDFRRTLYWNPNVKTDSSGRATVKFYNNATCEKLSLSAEGLTEMGEAVILTEN